VPGVDFESLADLSEVETMLAERVKEWTEEWKQQGRREGLRFFQAKVTVTLAPQLMG
jgi:hypothetical protein